MGIDIAQCSDALLSASQSALVFPAPATIIPIPSHVSCMYVPDPFLSEFIITPVPVTIPVVNPLDLTNTGGWDMVSWGWFIDTRRHEGDAEIKAKVEI